jgi:hypothetical protein
MCTYFRLEQSQYFIAVSQKPSVRILMLELVCAYTPGTEPKLSEVIANRV